MEFGRSGFGVTAVEKSPERVVIGFGDRDVTGQIVVGHAAVGTALNVGVAAQRVETATRPADVAEQELQHRGSMNQLHRVTMVRPAERVQIVPARSAVYVEVMSSAVLRKSSALQPQMVETISGV